MSAYQSLLAEEKAKAAATPLEEIDVSLPERFQNNLHWPWFDRLRKDSPVHWCEDSEFGGYWSVTTWDTVMTVDRNHRTFSSEAGGIAIGDFVPGEPRAKNFINADEPNHSLWRKPVQPAVAGDRIGQLEEKIAANVADILENLPVGEEFDWVERVSIELTTRTLAILFDFPFENRRKLTAWSDAITSTPRLGNKSLSLEERNKALYDMNDCFVEMIKEKRKQEPQFDFVSLMAHSPNFKNIEENPLLLIGQCLLLIVGGNDTTRNSASGGVHVLNEFPDQYDKLMADPSIIPNMVKEIIRWQTPLAHMRRTATEDAEVAGQKIKAGEKVIMWYISANRDESKFDQPYEFLIDRANAQNQASFGYGIHRCMGNHIAEMQLRALWREIVKRFKRIQVVGEPKRTMSNFVMGFEKLPVVAELHN